MSKFFDPLKGKMKKEHLLLNILGGLCVFFSFYAARAGYSIWACLAFAVAWYFLVYFVYLTYKYFKNNDKK